MTFKTIPLPDRSTKETREYAQAVKKGLESYFVIQNGKGWYVRQAGTKKDSILFDTKSAALDAARKRATKKNSEVFVFNNKGDLLARETAN